MVAKFFEQQLHYRTSADQLLRAALGDLAPVPARSAGPVDEVTWDVSLDGDVLRGGIVRDLLVRFSVPEGEHLYGNPVPTGMVATSVEIESDVGLVIREPVMPPTTPLTLAGTGEMLQVFEGDVTIRIPITHLSRSLTKLDDGQFIQRITGTIRWQSCDSETCNLPQTESFTIDVPADSHDRHGRDDGRNAAEHFQQMISRRSDLSIADVMDKISRDDQP